jgi:hypothetical protein
MCKFNSIGYVSFDVILGIDWLWLWLINALATFMDLMNKVFGIFFSDYRWYIGIV